MRDLIQDALDDTNDEKSAIGRVDGKVVRVAKEHAHTPKNETYWAVKVYFGDDDIPAEKETGLSAQEADALFREHTDAYDLITGDLEEDLELPDEEYEEFRNS